MPRTTEPLLSVAQVFELQPGDEQNASWINPGMVAVVREITQKKTKAGKDFFPCKLADQTGSATVECSFFTRPKFGQGDVIELSGKGLRRTEYNGNAQVAVGKDTEIHVVGKSVHHEEQKERAATGAPALNGTLQPIHGQTVGMAVKEAIGLAIVARPEGQDLGQALETETFWRLVKGHASNIIRISRALEAGKLSPASWAPAGEQKPANAPQRGSAKMPAPGPDGSAYAPDQETTEDIPF